MESAFHPASWLNLAKIISSPMLRRMLEEDESIAVVLFTGEWCPVCREFKPIWSRWTEGKSVPLFVVDVPRGGAEWKEWRIDEIPTVGAFSQGREVARVHGTITPDDLDGLLERIRIRV